MQEEKNARPPQVASSRPNTNSVVRKLNPEEVPASPIEAAKQLIACSGVWRNKEQYLATLFILQPLENLWQEAIREGVARDLHERGALRRFLKEIRTRTVFLHGPGGSGKTYCITEVVLKVMRMFLGWSKSISIIAIGPLSHTATRNMSFLS